MSDHRVRLREDLLEFAWGQWAQMGILAESSRDDRWVMDPEALILFSLSVGRSDPRLFDEVLDWLWRNGGLIGVQRLRNLSRGDDAQSRLADAAIEWVSVSNGAIRVPARPAPKRPLEDLFDLDGRPLRITSPDATFARFGWRRPPAYPGGRSVAPDTSVPINLAFRLRLMFGVGARAECIRVLLGSAPGGLTVADVARGAGFAKRNVADALSALAEAGLVDRAVRGNELRYRLDYVRFAPFVGLDVSRLSHRDWPALLGALTAVDRWLVTDRPDRSELLRAGSARDLIERIGSSLTACGLRLPPERRPGPAYLDGFWRTIDDAVALLAPVAPHAAGNEIQARTS